MRSPFATLPAMVRRIRSAPGSCSSGGVIDAGSRSPTTSRLDHPNTRSEAGTVSPRRKGLGQLEAMTRQAFIERVQKETRERSG